MSATIDNRLSAELRKLCGRLAAERTRPLAWHEARTIRQDMLRRLQAGEDAASLADEVRKAIHAAVAGQRA